MEKRQLEQTRNAINRFAVDLANCICMEDRRDSVAFLAERIGAKDANKVAELFGLTDPYYMAERVGA